MSNIVFIVSLYVRPAQKEILSKSVDSYAFNDIEGSYWDEYIECYLGSKFWDEIDALKINMKSIYKISFKLTITPLKYIHGYYGDIEYDEEYDTQILYCTRATTFRELRDGLHYAGIVTMTDEYLKNRYYPSIVKFNQSLNLLKDIL